jgi:hypothetical protein
MRVFLDSFSEGCFRIRSKSGKQTIHFDESERFGPSKVNMRTGDLDMITDKSWFWSFYQPWREGGRPVSGVVTSTPNGPLAEAVWADKPTV